MLDSIATDPGLKLTEAMLHNGYKLYLQINTVQFYRSLTNNFEKKLNNDF